MHNKLTRYEIFVAGLNSAEGPEETDGVQGGVAELHELARVDLDLILDADLRGAEGGVDRFDHHLDH